VKNSRSRLPPAPADVLTRPLAQFMRIEAMSGIALLFSTLIALTLANTAWSPQFLAFWELPVGVQIGDVEFVRSLKHWVNDGLMTFFFFTIALELKRGLVLGELRHPRMAALSIAAALGGMVLPVGIFLLLVRGTALPGWGTVMSTDTAFVIGCLAVLGSRIPEGLRLFLLSLAIFDDIGAVLAVALGYGEMLNWPALVLAGFGLALVAGLGRIGIRSVAVYGIAGCSVWLALDASGIHATVTGVILGLMTPTRSWVSDRRLHAIFERVTAYPPGDHWSDDKAARYDLRQAGVAAREALSPVERLEFVLHPWVALFIMPLFALANAGVPVAAVDFDLTLTIAIFAAFVAGKPLGVILFSFAAVRLGIATLPSDLPWRLLTAGALLTGIGFTMALFIAELAFDAALLNSVKLGVLGASVVSAAAGFLMLAWLTSPRRRGHSPRTAIHNES
jgi:Na+:H+ antiporter, NhaA family